MVLSRLKRQQCARATVKLVAPCKPVFSIAEQYDIGRAVHEDVQMYRACTGVSFCRASSNVSAHKVW